MLKTLLILIAITQTVAAEQLPEKFVSALRKTETFGKPNSGIGAKGRNGEIGPLQITKACFKDSGVSGHFANCNDLGFSIKVAEAYLNRYAKNAVLANDYQTMARIWNGGPNYSIKKTNGYWSRFQTFLNN